MTDQQAFDPETGEVIEDADVVEDGPGADLEAATYDELTLFPGGPKPTKSILKIKASKKEISNELKRGDELAVVLHLRIDEISFGGEDRVQVATVVDMFEHETDDNLPVGQQLMSTTEQAVPTDDLPDAEDASFARGEGEPLAQEQPVDEGTPEPEEDPDLRWD